MTASRLALLSLLACSTGLSSIPVGAQESELFHEPFRLRTPSGFVEAGRGYAAPVLFDIDEDGDRDLIVGQFRSGYFRVFRNDGRAEEGLFNDHVLLETGSINLSAPVG